MDDEAAGENAFQMFRERRLARIARAAAAWQNFISVLTVSHIEITHPMPTMIILVVTWDGKRPSCSRPKSPEAGISDGFEGW